MPIKLNTHDAAIFGQSMIMAYSTIYWKAWKVGWFQFRKMYRQWILDPSDDRDIIEYWRKILERDAIIPVRSSNLFSTIFANMFIRRWNYYTNRFLIDGRYAYPRRYPTFIANPRHSPPETGYGLHPSRVNRSFLPKNVTLLKTTKQSAKYLLNDPQALEDPRFYINQLIAQTLYLEMVRKFKAMVVTVEI